LICLPVRSYFGTFAYLTSPYALTVAREYLSRTGGTTILDIPFFTQVTDSYRSALPEGSRLVHQPLPNQVLLEDMDLMVDASQTELALQWANLISGLLHPNNDDTGERARRMFVERFVIVDDDVMSFLCETALPVAARICIGEDGVVKRGALWYEEYVPPESVFCGLVAAENGFGPHRGTSAADLLNAFCAGSLHCQVGGHATIGRGLVAINFGGTAS
jgi:CRISPR-associated protein Cmr4